MNEAAQPSVKGRGCNGCTLCCKVFKIPETQSARGEWCHHAELGKGCAIYAERPQRCRPFQCGYLVWEAVPDHWFPAESGIVIHHQPGRSLTFVVDPATPERWREQPWRGELDALARTALAERQQVLVTINAHTIALLPSREVDLGEVADDEAVLTGLRPDGVWGAAKVKKDDPRLADGGRTIPLG